MNHWSGIFIEVCWLAWLLYWLAMAIRTKRTVERGGVLGYRVVAIVLVIGLVALGRLAGVSAHSYLWHPSLALEIVSACLVLAGLLFTVWARTTLGRNWSSEVTFKQDHELIESGPYALVRQPIYTGLIAMALGTMINYGRAVGLAVFIALCGALWWKARQEERIMERHFLAAYADYRARVHAIVPFLL